MNFQVRVVRCRFFGGPAADRVMMWPDKMITGGLGIIQIPDEPPLAFWPVGDEPGGAELSYRIHEYRWDGTINSNLEYPMRWVEVPGWRPREDYDCPYGEQLLRELGLQ